MVPYFVTSPGIHEAENNLKKIEIEYQRHVSVHRFNDHKMEHPLCALFFFFFCMDGWSAALMAASNTALIFCTSYFIST